MHILHWCVVCCSAFQLGSIDRIGPAVKRLSNSYHPHVPLAIEATETAASYTGILYHLTTLHSMDCASFIEKNYIICFSRPTL